MCLSFVCWTGRTAESSQVYVTLYFVIGKCKKIQIEGNGVKYKTITVPIYKIKPVKCL